MGIYESVAALMQQRFNETLTAESRCFWVEVTDTDGQYVSIKLASSEDVFKDCKKVPIIQSQYFSPIVAKGDLGIALNIHLDIGNALEDLPFDRNVFNQDYLVFLPLITKKQFKSQADKLTISSQDLKSTIELSNEKLSIIAEKDIEQQAKGKYTITTNSGYSLKASSYTVEASGASPISMKNSVGGLGDVITQLFQCMDALAAGLTGQTSNPAAYNAAKPIAKALIDKIVV